MRVLWIVNIMLPYASKSLNLDKVNYGGWLQAYLDNLKDTSFEYFVICPSNSVNEIKEIKNNNITYLVTPYNQLTQQNFESLIKKIKPVLVHIHGTEELHSLYMAKAAKSMNIKAVVSIQGIITEYEKVLLNGIPKKYQKYLNIKKSIKFACNLARIHPRFLVLEKESFSNAAIAEIEILNLVDYVIGRSKWDKDSVLNINTNLKYFHVNENLRSVFYENEYWSYDSCEKHSIFISQANYPIKGFHFFLEALNIVKRTYPNTKVYIAGGTPFARLNSKMLNWILSPLFEYSHILKKKIRKYKLADNLIFLDTLTDKQMKDMYLKSNIFVSASIIENSPNSVSEAMIIGVPIITSEVGGVGSVFNYGKDGLSYQFDDHTTLANHIIELFNMKEKVNIYTDNARKTANKICNINTNIEKLILAYNEILLEEK